MVGHQTRLGKVTLSKPAEARTPTGIHRVVDGSGKLVWRNEEDKVQCIVLLRKGEDSLPALKDVEKKVEELNDPESGKMLPGVFIEPYYDRTDLINVTTDTVQENLFLGMVLVTVILLMFLSNVRTRAHRGHQHPAGAAVRLRDAVPARQVGQPAVDRGRGLRHHRRFLGHHGREHLPPPQLRRVRRAAAQGAHPAGLHARSTKPLLFSTLIMVCAFMPLFTMQGPEGQIFGPMADTYAFALGGALVLAVTAGAGPVPAVLPEPQAGARTTSWCAG